MFMMFETNTDEPPLPLLRPKLTRVWSKATYWLLPVALIVSVSANNLMAQASYSSDLRNYVTLEPKAKLTAFNAIDAFTPVVQESRDVEPVVIADVTPGDLIVAKTNPVKTDERVETKPTPVERTAVVTHTVTSGETLSGIAAAYHISVGSIKVENAKLSNIDALSIGDTLSIPPREYDPTYIAATLKARTPKSKVTLASATAASRTVTVRSTSDERYSDNGLPNFQRPTLAVGYNGYHDWASDTPKRDGGPVAKASADGVVIEVATGYNGGYGNKVIIDHGGGVQTLYAHLDSFLVSAGQHVSAGDPIGIIGSTGRTIPAHFEHLHFEIRIHGQRVNPLKYIK